MLRFSVVSPRWPGLAMFLLGLMLVPTLRADVELPNVFGSHMVLQREQKNPVWGHAAAKEEVTVTIDQQTKTTAADDQGNWKLTLDPIPVGGPYKMTVKGKNEIVFDDVLVGEVWICSGQSNMQWSVNAAKDPDLEKAAAKYPNIRLLTVPNVGTQEPQWNFNGKWQPCTPDTVGNFSAVGYFFGRQLHQTLDVPVGLINNAWGGSACEAWIRRDLLTADERYKPLMDRWAQTEAKFEADLKKWQEDDAQAKSEGKKGPNRPAENQMRGNSRPANIYNGALKPTIGYGIRGAIWYQGESNAGRAYQYRELFPLMIKSWREEWGQGDFPFYWVQLADFMAEKSEPGDSAWAELREAQTMTATKLPNTGEAVIIDIGEGKDIHPKNKQDVAQRLARLAFSDIYTVHPENSANAANRPNSLIGSIVGRSPTYKSMEKQGNRVILTFDNVVGGWRPFDVNEPRGFAIAGEDKKFVWAQAKVAGDKIEVWSDKVENPASVRYGWADNPVCNMYSGAGLPLTPFRTDDWPGITANAN